MKKSKFVKIAIMSLSCFLFSAVFSGAAYFEVVNSFYLAEDFQPAGLAWDGDSLWVTNSSTHFIFQLDTDGTIITSFDSMLIGTQGPSGITLDGDGFLRVATWTERKIYKYSTNGILQSYFEAPIPGIRGTTWDGTNLWIAGGGWPNDPADIVHFYKMTIEGGIIDYFELALETNPFYRDLAFDGTNLWLITQSGDNNLFMISPEGDLLANYHLLNDVGVPGTPKGLTWDGTHLWVACISPNAIYQLKPVSPYLPVNEYVDVATIPDLNDDGFDEIGCLLVDSETGISKVLIKDGETKIFIKTISFFSFDFIPKSITVLPDMNDNGFPEIGVLAINKINQNSILLVKDIGSKEKISRIFFMNNNFIPTGISRENDLNGNGMPEVTVIRKNRTTRQATALTKDAMTGELLRTIYFPQN